MILCLVIFYFLGGSSATNDTTNTTEITGNSSFSKSIMCKLSGDLEEMSSDLVDLEVTDMPCECEVIIYDRFSVDILSTINVDEAKLKSVIDLGKPVLPVIHRTDNYPDWSVVLGSEGNAKETKILCDFAMKNNISGYIVDNLTPQCMYRPFEEGVGKGIIPYLQQLKCTPNFIIGVAVQPYGSTIKNPCFYNFAEMNDLVTFYEIQTSCLNRCIPQKYNGQTPIMKSEHGENYMFGMEEVVEFLKESKICLEKLTYDIDINPLDMSSPSESNTYTQACKGDLNISASCIQTTKNLYDKGKFVLEQDSGVVIRYIDLDDIKNDCGCDTPFVGFKNIIAGLRGCPYTSCEKYDIQSGEYQFT